MDIPGAYPSSEPPTPHVYPHQQNPHQYQHPQDARVPTSVQDGRLGHAGSEAGLTEQRVFGAQQQEHRYNEPLSQAIPAVEGGEVQSHRDDSFQSHAHRQLGQPGQTSQPEVHRYEQPRTSAIPAVMAAEVQSHRDDSTLRSGGTQEGTHSVRPVEQEQYSRYGEQPKVHRYEEPESRATQAVLSGQLQTHRDDATRSQPRQSQSQPQPIISEQSRQAIAEGSQKAAQQAKDVAVAAKDNIVATAYAAGQTASTTTGYAASYLPESVQQVLPTSVQEAIPSPTSTSSNQVRAPEISSLVPTEVKGSIQKSGQSAEAAANTDAVLQKNAVETELLQEVKEAGPSGNSQQHLQSSRRGEEWPLRSKGQEQPEHHHEQLTDQEKDTPYRGSLPTAAQGGIYNSVTGHGSPRDDHHQHHGLPERSRRQGDEYPSSQVQSQSQSQPQSHPRSLGSGGVAGTGIYNTVIGHGSQDEHARQHSSGPSGHSSTSSAPVATDGINTNTVPTQSSGTGHHGSDYEHAKQQALSGAPGASSSSAAHPGAQRDGREETPHDSHTGRNVAAGAGVGAAALVGTRALQDRHTSSVDTGPHTSPQDGRDSALGTAPNVSRGTSIGQTIPIARSTQSNAGAQRAFPLTSSGPEGLSEADKSSNTDSQAREGLTAGAAAGIGSGAYEYAHKHKAAEQQATQSPVAHPARQSATTQEATDHHGFLQHHTQQQQQQQQQQPQQHQHTLRKSPSPDAKASHSRSSSQSEKQRHGMLGMFSRKDEGTSSHPKVAEDEKGHRVLAKEPPADIAPAVIAARQASVRHQRRQSPEREVQNSQGAAAPGSVSHAHKNQGHQQYASTELESGSRRGEKSQPHDIHTHHGQELGAGAGAAAAGGLSASESSHRHDEASTAQDRQGQSASTLSRESLPPHFSNTHNTVTGDELPYNTLASGTPSGIAMGSKTHGPRTHGSQMDGASNATRTSAPQGASDRHPESHVGRDAAVGAGVGAAAVAGSRAINASDSGRDASRDTRTGGGQTGTHHSTTIPDDYRSGTHDNNLGGVTDTSATDRQGEHGPHSSRVANAVDPRVEGQSTTGPNTSDAYSQDKQLNPHTGRNLAAGAGAGAAVYAGSQAIHDRQATDSYSTGTTFGDPNFTRPAHAAGQPQSRGLSGSTPRQDIGQYGTTDLSSGTSDGYDHLASGTPSGVATSSTSSPHGQQQPGSIASAQERYAGPHEDKRSEIASGVSAGAAAYAGSRAVEDQRHPFSTNTRSVTDRYTSPGLAGEDASAYTAGATTDRTSTNPHTRTAGGSDGYDHLASGTPSGVAHERAAEQDNVHSHSTKAAPLSRETRGAEGPISGTSSRTDAYQHLASGTASGVAAGAAGAAAAHRTGDSAVHDGARGAATAQATSHGSGASEPPLYNVLPSGTPSGVNIEHIRRSKELSRDQ